MRDGKILIVNMLDANKKFALWRVPCLCYSWNGSQLGHAWWPRVWSSGADSRETDQTLSLTQCPYYRKNVLDSRMESNYRTDGCDANITNESGKKVQNLSKGVHS
jgi:hypothetical protein